MEKALKKGFRTGYRTGYRTGIALVSHWGSHRVLPVAYLCRGWPLSPVAPTHPRGLRNLDCLRVNPGTEVTKLEVCPMVCS